MLKNMLVGEVVVDFPAHVNGLGRRCGLNGTIETQRLFFALPAPKRKP
jgi:hypothetical protein